MGGAITATEWFVLPQNFYAYSVDLGAVLYRFAWEIMQFLEKKYCLLSIKAVPSNVSSLSMREE